MCPGVVEKGGEFVALPTTPVAAASTVAAGMDGRRQSQVSTVEGQIPETHSVAPATDISTRSGRDQVSLSGVMAAVERVYERRKALSLTQMENKSVISQVQNFSSFTRVRTSSCFVRQQSNCVLWVLIVDRFPAMNFW